MSLVIVMTAGCVRDKKENKSSENGVSQNMILNEDSVSKESNINKIDILVAVNLAHDHDAGRLPISEYIIINDTENGISIDTNSEYSNQYNSGNRFNLPLSLYCAEEVIEYLTLELDTVNNTNQRISVNELDLNVGKSELDKDPYIYIDTTYWSCNSITFANRRWHDWKGFTFSYSILKEGQLFNGKYDKNIHIPYFEGEKIIDMLQDLKNLGYDFEGAREWIQRWNIDMFKDGTDPWVTESDGGHYLLFGASEEDDLEHIREKFHPFSLKKHNSFDEYEARAALYGSIKFDQTDIVKDFIADLALSTLSGFGAYSKENDIFDIKLPTSGESYIKRFPYTTVIEPHGAEMVKLTIKTDKSSNHKFFIDVVNDSGLTIRSKNLLFHSYAPKYE